MDLTPLRICGLLLVLCSGLLAEDQLTCNEFNPCRCVTSNGDVFDLESVGFANQTARFQETWTGEKKTNVTVFYNPCKPFNESVCTDAAACLNVTSDYGPALLLMAKHEQDRVQWSFEDKQPSLIYTYFDRTFKVNLICNDSENLNITSVTTSLVEADLRSHCACANGCTSPDPKTDDDDDDKSGLSTGSILVILFFTVVVAYLIAGVVYKKVVYGATGKELIPNVEFWTAFPKLVLDGLAFTCNCCRRRQGSTGYDDV